MYRWLLLLVGLIAAGAGLAVGVMNPDPVAIRLPGHAFELALGPLIMLVFVVGTVFGLILFMILFHLPSRWTDRRKAAGSDLSRIDE